MAAPGLMVAPVFVCPECGGRQLGNHPGGVLAIQHETVCGLRDRDDATRAADASRVMRYGQPITRDVTPTERATLAANITVTDKTGASVDVDALLKDTFTVVAPVVGVVTVLNRAWPGLGVGTAYRATPPGYTRDVREHI